MLTFREILRGLCDLIEGLWNEEGVLARNAEPPLNRVPTADELSYRR